MIIVIYGEESFLMNQKLKSIKKTLPAMKKI